MKDKDAVLAATALLQKKLYDLLYLMFAEGRRSLLIILHGIDTSGKDGVVRFLFESANPQGLQVFAFKKPSEEELRHDYLWRCHRHTPEAGYAAIFNRSYYEEVTTVMVHKELLETQHLPTNIMRDPNIFKKRYEHINQFEKMLSDNGTIVVKFLLDISKNEQKERLEARLKDRSRNWKFSPEDAKERKSWDAYMKAFKKMVKHTDTKWARWYVIPSDKKWLRNYEIAKVLVKTLEGYKMAFPKVEQK